jgi:hypothetical protein
MAAKANNTVFWTCVLQYRRVNQIPHSSPPKQPPPPPTLNDNLRHIKVWLPSSSCSANPTDQPHVLYTSPPQALGPTEVRAASATFAHGAGAPPPQPPPHGMTRATCANNSETRAPPNGPGSSDAKQRAPCRRTRVNVNASNLVRQLNNWLSNLCRQKTPSRRKQ